MYLNSDDEIKVIKSLRDIERIRKENEKMTGQEWIIAIAGSSCMIVLLFSLANILKGL